MSAPAIKDALAALRRARTFHGETLPRPGPEREAWKQERAQFDALEAALLERLNRLNEVRA